MQDHLVYQSASLNKFTHAGDKCSFSFLHSDS